MIIVTGGAGFIGSNILAGLSSLIEILSSRSHKTPACNAPRSPQGKIIAREQGVSRPNVSAFRPKHNIIGPKLCNKSRAAL